MSNKLEKLYEMSLMKWGFDWLPATPPGTYLESYETFKQKIESDKVFYKQIIDELGVHIEERELNLDERAKFHPTPEIFYEIHGTFSISDSIENSNFPDKDWLHDQFDRGGIPSKLITLTYNNETIEVYE